MYWNIALIYIAGWIITALVAYKFSHQFVTAKTAQADVKNLMGFVWLWPWTWVQFVMVTITAPLYRRIQNKAIKSEIDEMKEFVKESGDPELTKEFHKINQGILDNFDFGENDKARDEVMNILKESGALPDDE